ncbi:methyltransferase, FkbM family [Methylococcus capsulatus str. Bath]|uniref:Methyltransferase, FkbM family n=1 Tax=Methylococcus capsulatus (strain ATCC 33009 / NCIMB 11132 / Bath) TaxID=243233 RepID=Q609S1_METCA|nr:FkbM family methyltransferase [Methylococcus capsulatus]AAU92794.1 methyltransferase, FkbM family [Methylococcus capsulatus str. Bath]
MFNLRILARKTGLTQLLKPLIHKSVSRLGFALLYGPHAPERVWTSLASRPFRTVLDIGACRGGYAETILRTNFPGASIHSFEPSPIAFPVLEQVAARSAGRIVAHNFGLGERTETLKLRSAINSLPSSSLLLATETNTLAFPQTQLTEDLEVDIRALDEVAPMLDPAIEDDLLVKIDVQGFEDRVIRGGRQTIARARAAIIEVQVEELYAGQPSFRDIFLLMDEMGFVFTGVLDQYADSEGRVLYFDAVFLKA